LSLPSHKDRLFAYPKVLTADSDGAYRVIDYQELRDINGRDAVPVRRAKSRYVSLGVRKARKDLVLKEGALTVPHVATGKTKDASVITIYLHGQGGDRKQGVNDYSFGGNFNRIGNLMVKAGGLYLTPDFTDFDKTGVAEIKALIAHYGKASSGAPVFVACGSAGGALCWQLARDSEAALQVSGLLLLGSYADERFLSSMAFKRRIPVFFGHGSRDRVFSVDGQEAFFRKIQKRAPGYPAQFVRFETGTHGTPIRMTDWRETLNWMLQNR